MKYKDKRPPAGSIIEDTNTKQQYVIMQYNPDPLFVALAKCDINKEIQQFKEEGKYFVNLTNPIMGHAMRVLRRNQKTPDQWIWKPVTNIEEFEVIYY